ncbi:MAG: hypothetical protein J6N95_08545 [Bacilli bacterium]|nr:hypothetical protein [Bacilli bacterium]
MDFELLLLILRNSVIFIIALYLLAVVFDIIFVVSFSSILARHEHDLFLTLTSKKEHLDRLLALLNKNGIKLDKKTIEPLEKFDLKSIEHQDGESAKYAREQLTLISEYLLLTSRSNDVIANSEEFLELSASIDEIEKVYRQHILLYNADVLGYNFWITFFPTAYIYKIFKKKKKDIIS